MPITRRVLRLLPFCLVAILVCGAHRSDAGAQTLPAGTLAATSDSPRAKIWIHFADHGESSEAELRAMLARVELNVRARERRARRSRASRPDVHDLGVDPDYVAAVRALGGEIRHESRYFNAVSAWATPEQAKAIARLPFVRHVDRVRTGTRPIPPGDPHALDAMPKATAALGDIDYGLSEAQHEMINTKPLHREGHFGQGVRVAVLDTGFFRAHPALEHLHVIDEWDFVNDDPVTTDQANDPEGQMFHGTWSIGILASYWPGLTMGVAWEAEYILTKTEHVVQEVRSEEDDYIAALEWADGLGADLVSSSLGYFRWYTQEEMDGDTALITRAVDIAASRGMLVVTAVGNEGMSSWGTLIAPADADSAIAVGAVDRSGVIEVYSSRGPTADGRTKPDVVAQGELVATLHWQTPPVVAGASGTSAAAPLVAGAAALILQEHPDWSPIQVRDALRTTGSRSDAPGNDYGWGIIDAYAAVHAGDAMAVEVDVRPGSCENPFNPRSRGALPVLLLGGDELDVHRVDPSTLRLAGGDEPTSSGQPGGTALRAHVADITGPGECSSSAPDGHDDLMIQFDSAGISATIPGAARDEAVSLTLTGQLLDGGTIEGEATVRIVADAGGPGLAKGSSAVGTTGLDGAVPNPFNPITRIAYRLARAAHVELAVYDLRGRRVTTLVDAERPPGEHAVVWDASGRSSGVYFYRLRADGVEETAKLLLLK